MEDAGSGGQDELSLAVFKADEHALVTFAQTAFAHAFSDKRRGGLNGKAAEYHFVFVTVGDIAVDSRLDARSKCRKVFVVADDLKFVAWEELDVGTGYVDALSVANNGSYHDTFLASQI